MFEIGDLAQNGGDGADENFEIEEKVLCVA